MHWNKTLLLTGIVILVFGLTRCGKDDPKPNPIGPTPYTLNIPEGFPAPFMPNDNPLTEEGIELGRHLFYDKRLSSDLSMSCASCHHQQFAFSDLPDNPLSTGVTNQQTRRNAMPIFNLAWQEFFFWDGRAKSLEEQSLHPIVDPVEMNNDLPTVISRLEADTAYPQMFKAAFGDNKITEDRLAKAIAQFERTIISADSKFDRVVRLQQESFTASEQRGFDMFKSEEGDCFHCHGHLETQFLMGAFGRDNSFINNGLKADYSADQGRMEVTGDPDDLGRFKVPSTRNITVSFPYMHDGSIPSLDSLIEFYNFGGHPGPDNNIDPNMKQAGVGQGWTRQQKQDLAAFLATMTDFTFLDNEAFSDPFDN